MEIYQLKITNKQRKSIWRKVEISSSSSLGQLDMLIRDTFDYDQLDHLSEFYRTKVWSSTGFGEIEPGGQGIGAVHKLRDLKLKLGDKMEYIYDFGACWISIVELLEIRVEEHSKNYPKVIEKNKTRYKYCTKCKSNGKKNIAIYSVCYIDDNSIEVLCSTCVDQIDEQVDFDLIEISYV